MKKEFIRDRSNMSDNVFCLCFLKKFSTSLSESRVEMGLKENAFNSKMDEVSNFNIILILYSNHISYSKKISINICVIVLRSTVYLCKISDVIAETRAIESTVHSNQGIKQIIKAPQLTCSSSAKTTTSFLFFLFIE